MGPFGMSGVANGAHDARTTPLLRTARGFSQGPSVTSETWETAVRGTWAPIWVIDYGVS